MVGGWVGDGGRSHYSEPADDWPRQPSAGGTPQSPFKSISVMNLSSGLVYFWGGDFSDCILN